MLNRKKPQSDGYKTLFVDVMLNDRFVFTLRYRYCPLFRINLEDVAKAVVEKRPSLKGKPFQLWIDN